MAYRCQTCGDTTPRHFPSEKSARCRACERCAQFRSKYGISRAQVQRMRWAQGGRCAICHVEAFLVVDHNHATGRVRGMICHACNKGLGMFQDSAHVAEAAARYLRETND